jgi:hypothetical protein
MSHEQTHISPSDESLLFYFYRDGLSTAEREAVSNALQHDAELAARYRVLTGQLQSMEDTEVQQVPEHLQHQWHALVSREAQLERQRQQVPQGKKLRPGWVGGFAAGLASVLVLGIAIGLYLRPGTTPLTGAVETAGSGIPAPEIAELMSEPAGAPPSASFRRGVERYLNEQQAGLAQLTHGSSEDQQWLLLQILAQNRLIERAAMANQAPELARLMRAFEPILLRMTDPATGADEAQALQRQLAFELQAVLTKLQQAPSKPATVI